MRISSVLHYFLNRLTEKEDAAFSFPRIQQERYLQRFSEPKDDIERSYFQYLCQMKIIRNPLIRLGMNLASLPALLFYLLKSNDHDKKHEDFAAVFFSDGKPSNIIPRSLKEQYSGIYVIDGEKSESLNRTGKKYLLKIWRRYPFSWYFILKTVLKLRYYCYVIDSFRPQAIIVCNEYSFTSSALTQFCRMNNVQHINVMHGEKLYFIRDSFFRFDRCYIWDPYYKELFCRLRAEPDQFVVEVPESLSFVRDGSAEKSVDYTYYLGGEKGETLKKIVDSLAALQQKGKKTAIRPHPRYSPLDELREIAGGMEIEDNKALSIEDSLIRTKNAISLYSTVLNQAYGNGVQVVIDDVSDQGRFSKLKELGYIMLTKNNRLLSEVLGEKDEKTD